MHVIGTHCRPRDAVIRCGEGCQDNITAVNTNHVGNCLQDVEIKMGVPRDGAVEASLQERRPLLLQHSLRPSHVVLTNLSHPWENYLSHAVVLHRYFPEEEVDVVSIIYRLDKIRFF